MIKLNLINYIFSIIALVLFTFSLSYANPIQSSILEQAKTRYYEAKSKGLIQKEILVIIDFSLPSNQKRLWVLDMKHNKVLLNTYVTHGAGSGGVYATSFSNQANSHKSSLGLYITKSTYIGKNGLSLRIRGLDSTNNNAESRAIVIHGANYIGDNKTGRSWGCFAVPMKEHNYIINLIKNGSVIYAGYK